ncbi:MAG: Lrp/AsnC family transcriptional regulator [Gemmiger sp.]|nr:Lrp/AsnC family transcriptional regulator [Gemmiger sp.]MDY5783123.1 Lrp/AsnC family transcriptional regulator [Gemmiger sp.]
MDELDNKIIRLLMHNARMPVKEIAKQVNLTSPAVSSRIHRLEQEGVIGGYTVLLHRPGEEKRVEALISIQTTGAAREDFLLTIANEPQILQCYRVTGSYNFIVKASCAGIDELEHLLTRLQKFGSTNTQIILTTPLDRQLSL